MHPFYFKGFQVAQSNVGLKVNTDAILLGAHVCRQLTDSRKLLDIGSGTGVISAMLASHPQVDHVTAVDIDSEAASTTRKTMESHPQQQRWTCLQQDARSLKLPETVDWVVSNPPYFTSHFSKTPRGTARQQNSLRITDLICTASRNTHPDGRLSIIYPAEAFDTLRSSLLLNAWYLQHVIWVSDKKDDVAKRVLVTASKTFVQEHWDQFHLFEVDGKASKTYTQWVKPWYLEMPKRKITSPTP